MTSVLHYREPLSYRSHDLMHSSNFIPPSMASLKKTPPFEGHSSGSESKRGDGSNTKRRPSRAGTRSVTTLTAAQLERKRANDREAQRAIRQRTKDHIAELERQIHELTIQRNANSSDKLMELMRRNEELEQENTLLRSRLSHAVAALGVSDQSTGNVIAVPDHSGLISATGSAPSPSDRIQMLSQPRPSAETPRSVHSVPEMATPVSQPGHWPTQQPYTPNVSSPHGQASPMGDVPPHSDPSRWNPHSHPHQSQQPVSMPVQEQSLHSMDSTAMSYPSPYGLDNHGRAMSYPLENQHLITSQPMQMTGYNTPTSTRSPHPSDYPRAGMPMNAHGPPPHPAHQQQHSQQQGPPPTYSSFPPPGHQNFVPHASHPGDMQSMGAPHPQPQQMSEQGHMMYQQYPPNMKVEH